MLNFSTWLGILVRVAGNVDARSAGGPSDCWFSVLSQDRNGYPKLPIRPAAFKKRPDANHNARQKFISYQVRGSLGRVETTVANVMCTLKNGPSQVGLDQQQEEACHRCAMIRYDAEQNCISLIRHIFDPSFIRGFLSCTLSKLKNSRLPPPHFLGARLFPLGSSEVPASCGEPTTYGIEWPTLWCLCSRR